MRNILPQLFIVATITALGAFAADNSLGTWKLNMEKSKFSPAAPVKSLTATREASDGGVKVTTTGERSDGAAINGSYTAKYDGKEYPVAGAPYDTIAIKQGECKYLYDHAAHERWQVPRNGPDGDL
jgi:hypothetical protein